MHVFAAHDSVDVENTDFDEFDAAFLNQFSCIIGGFDILRLHRRPPVIWALLLYRIDRFLPVFGHRVL
jgi:hypothetical protein